MPANDLAACRAAWGTEPIPHQGPDGIVAAIKEIFTRNGFPEGEPLAPAQQQIVITELPALYTQHPKFSQLHCWPAARDWLRLNFSPSGLNIPD